MTMYELDDEVAFLIDRHAPRFKPFENITLQEGLRRILNQYLHPTIAAGGTASIGIQEMARQVSIENAMQTARTIMRKTPTPSAIDYARSVPELAKQRHLTTWKAITDALDIDTLGDSARRKLAAWVKVQKPNWPAVPEIEGD